MYLPHCNCGYLLVPLCPAACDNTCRNIRNRYSFDFDLNSILSDLILRILSPSSKLSSYSFCKSLLEPPNMIFIRFTVLSVIAKENDYISLMSTGTVILLFHATTGFSTMTAQTSSSRSKRLMISENTGNQRERTESYRSDGTVHG